MLKEEEILEETKLIAAFLGYKYYKQVLIDNSDCGGLYDWTMVFSKIPIEVDEYPKENQCYLKEGFVFNNYTNLIFDPKYHEDWNELMPVVEKIEKLGYFCMINKWTSIYTGSENNRIKITTVEGIFKITNTYQAVIEFIKWYNNEKCAE